MLVDEIEEPRVLVFSRSSFNGIISKPVVSPVRAHEFLDFVTEKEREGIRYKPFDAVDVYWDEPRNSNPIKLYWSIRKFDEMLAPRGAFLWNFGREPAFDEVMVLHTTLLALFGRNYSPNRVYRKQR